MNFQDLPLNKKLLRGLEEAGYETATPIQQKAIPKVLQGRDLIGCAQTGTGKTAAFALPTLQRLLDSATATGAGKRRKRANRRVIRCLILAPTRELAGQIGESFGTYGNFTDLRHTVIFGGVGQGNQVRAVDKGVDILVATPGRLLDLIGQGIIDLGHIEILILDEADQMLDMGFIHDLRKIVRKCPVDRQTLMFSATMPPEIRKLSQEWLDRPFELHVAPVASTPDLVSQAIYYVERKKKMTALVHLLNDTPRSRTLVFSRTKWGADRIAKVLNREGIKSTAIHGNKSQNRRQAAIKEFKSEQPPVLIATDIAARGLDFDDISHVINYDLPDTPETYVHRIGRTARAGASGEAISLCDSEEKKRVRGIERLTGSKIRVKNLPKLEDLPKPQQNRKRNTNKPKAKADRSGRDGAGGREKSASGEKHGQSKPSKQRKFRGAKRGARGDARNNDTHNSESHEFESQVGTSSSRPPKKKPPKKAKKKTGGNNRFSQKSGPSKKSSSKKSSSKKSGNAKPSATTGAKKKVKKKKSANNGSLKKSKRTFKKGGKKKSSIGGSSNQRSGRNKR